MVLTVPTFVINDASSDDDGGHDDHDNELHLAILIMTGVASLCFDLIPALYLVYPAAQGSNYWSSKTRGLRTLRAVLSLPELGT